MDSNGRDRGKYRQRASDMDMHSADGACANPGMHTGQATHRNWRPMQAEASSKELNGCLTLSNDGKAMLQLLQSSKNLSRGSKTVVVFAERQSSCTCDREFWQRSRGGGSACSAVLWWNCWTNLPPTAR